MPEGESLFSEKCTRIRIIDDAAGEYLEVEQQSQSGDTKHQMILIEPEEWEVLKQGIETMLEEISIYEKGDEGKPNLERL